MIEMAVTLPLFILLIFATIEIYWVLHARQTMLAAAREGARTLAVTDAAVADAESVTEEILEDTGLPDTATVTGTDGDCDPDPTAVTMEVTMPMEDIILLGNVFGIFTADDMTVRVTMRKECPLEDEGNGDGNGD